MVDILNLSTKITSLVSNVTSAGTIGVLQICRQTKCQHPLSLSYKVHFFSELISLQGPTRPLRFRRAITIALANALYGQLIVLAKA